ncbi:MULTISPECIES: hypothetical protein [unclassified Rhizobium]|uniref:hypothetical protein n=1 Tax=unclassified Rhizobium TaxID=2613769 RepID=UPI001ADC4E59|nr:MULTISPECIES: hypothetical protein [unclassified Rhizobium]MBO9099439.1 hypothetical protein [Rhizobium sp. L58/93]QXZ87075.1 hypothetical protein J5287_21040 [Rhizobium sp. K1/93]QXZ92891.1 hypothetical protein J5280_19855 [Rhizobium sp. K15/93]
MKKLLLLLVVPLAGCVDTSSPKFQQMTAQKCEAYGFKSGSPEMANCRMNLAMLQEQDNMRRKQNMARAVSESVDEFNANQQRQADRNAYIMAHQQPSYQAPLYRPPINCVSQRNFGGTVTTSCQ